MKDTIPAYVTRDDNSDDIWVWLKPNKGNWKPTLISDEGACYYQRESMDETDKQACFDKIDFRKVFGGNVLKPKSIKYMHLDKKELFKRENAKYPFYFGKSYSKKR